VLCITGLGADIRQALEAAYARIDAIRFEFMQCRHDIGWRALERTNDRI